MKIGLLHPGAMGVAVAQTLVNGGHEVCWLSTDRSPATHHRAETAGLVEFNSLQALSESADLIISVCPPHGAETLAQTVADAGFGGTYIDANAISPQRTKRIGKTLTANGIDYIDGGLIGGPPKERGRTWLYLSGEGAKSAVFLFSAGPMECEAISTEIGDASALKMCFAARTKTSNALLANILAAADTLGVRAQLEKQWEVYDEGFTAKAHHQVKRVAHQKAWRFAGELQEIADTFDAIGLPDGFFTSASDIFTKEAPFKEVEPPPTLEEVLASLNG